MNTASPSDGRDQTWRAVVASTGISAVMAIMIGWGTLHIVVIGIFALMAFLSGIWSLFWFRINNHFPRFQVWISKRAQIFSALALPTMILLVVVLGINAVEHLNVFWNAKTITVVKVSTVTKVVPDPSQTHIIRDQKDEIQALRAELVSRPIREITKPASCLAGPVPPQSGATCPVLDLSSLHITDQVGLHLFLDPKIKDLESGISSAQKAFGDLEKAAKRGDFNGDESYMPAHRWDRSSIYAGSSVSGLENTAKSVSQDLAQYPGLPNVELQVPDALYIHNENIRLAYRVLWKNYLNRSYAANALLKYLKQVLEQADRTARARGEKVYQGALPR